MLFLKKISKSLLLSIILFIILTFLMTLFNYIGLFNLKVLNISTYIIPFIVFFISAFMLGKKSLKKGYIEGLKLGFIEILLLFIFNFLTYDSGFKLDNIILYVIVIISSALGSMLGINKKN